MTIILYMECGSSPMGQHTTLYDCMRILFQIGFSYGVKCRDLKSFYASVECVDRGLDPLTTNLVVADASRTEKTICLAVFPR